MRRRTTVARTPAEPRCRACALAPAPPVVAKVSDTTEACNEGYPVFASRRLSGRPNAERPLLSRVSGSACHITPRPRKVIR